MDYFTLTRDTKIRILKRAIKNLERFNKDLNKHISAGTLEMTPQMRIVARQHAEKEGIFRRKLATYTKEELDNPQSPTAISHRLANEISKLLPDFSQITEDCPFDGSNQLKIRVIHQDTYQIDLVAKDISTYKEIDTNLTTALTVLQPDNYIIYDIEPIFVLIPTVKPNEIDEDFMTRSYEIHLSTKSSSSY